MRRAADLEIGDFDPLLARSRVITLNFDAHSSATHYPAWLHIAAYHRARAGGVASFSFSELHHWPVHYRPGAAPPPEEAWWELNPCVFRNAVDGEYFDYVLVRGHVDPFADEPEGPVFHAVARSRDFTLYEKSPSASAAPDRWPAKKKPDEGPCAARSSGG
jgi:hypothetical protein